jgi:hypothetical protein
MADLVQVHLFQLFALRRVLFGLVEQVRPVLDLRVPTEQGMKEHISTTMRPAKPKP